MIDRARGRIVGRSERSGIRSELGVRFLPTSPTTADGSVLYDPLLPAFVEDPYPFYARLRDESPVHLSPGGDGWVLSRYADVQMLLRDPRFGRSGFDSYVVAVLGPGPVEQSFRRWMLFMDPQPHPAAGAGEQGLHAARGRAAAR